MSAQEPITKAELVALHDLGYVWLNPSGNPRQVPDVANSILEAYHAGVRDGRRTPHEPPVFRSGDPEPGPEVGGVLDSEGDVWARKGDDSWGMECDGWTWALQYGPLVGLPPLPDWRAAVKADVRSTAGGDQ